MFIKPCEGRITSPFGMRTHPVTKKPSTMHWGIDLAKTGNVPVLAAASGTVSRVQRTGTFGTYGNTIMIVHKIGGKTYETVYAHLRSYNVKVGQSVKAGQTIGIMGNTGGSTGQHLHFEVHTGRWNNKYSNAKNPVHYMIDPDIEVLQQLLINAGHKVAVDGINGPGTLAAVKAFQKASGLVVDGSAGLATMAALEKFTKQKEEVIVTNNKPSATHADAWKWATDKKLMNGERPGDPLTREQFATVLKRYDDAYKK
ncbi:peptidoglycan DD-metalloendopeptidase family protein [Sporosarcina sp. FSL K6-1522]|uniref:peptidoglycan DD-metalloendopeptidase family protein n=1 Tax=Sporosarcina sp. FSL K6-1522 TaxID=2921554 RepID=UPI00315A2F44